MSLLVVPFSLLSKRLRREFSNTYDLELAYDLEEFSLLPEGPKGKVCIAFLRKKRGGGGKRGEKTNDRYVVS